MTLQNSTLSWTKLQDNRWDATRDALFTDSDLAAVGMSRPALGTPIPDEWWQASADGVVLGYGWLDSEWGDAQITFFVPAEHRGRGIGTVLVDRLEQEAGARLLNYVYNVVPATHPDRQGMTRWLTARGFRPTRDGNELRRRVPAARP